jgi:hypothetical protein
MAQHRVWKIGVAIPLDGHPASYRAIKIETHADGTSIVRFIYAPTLRGIPAMWGHTCTLRLSPYDDEVTVREQIQEQFEAALSRQIDGSESHVLLDIGLSAVPEGQRVTVERRAYVLLDYWAALLPARIANEDLGDYLEDITNRAAAGQTWAVYLRIFAAVFWTGVNATGYALKRLRQRRTA